MTDRYLTGSRVVSTLGRYSSSLKTIVRQASRTSDLRSLYNTFSRWYGSSRRTSTVFALVRSIARFTRHSLLYRWLTAEPDPKVIVIDLRETYTIGPIITLLDTLVSTVAPWVRTSRLGQVSKFAGHQKTIMTNSRALQALQTVLEPPAPPERDEDSDFRK